MAQAMKVTAEPRTAAGTSNARRMRREGKLPGNVYGLGKNLLIQLDRHTFAKAMSKHESEHLLMDLEIVGEGVKKVLLQEMQHHPVTGAITHVDFQEISMTKKLRIEIPVRLVGEPLGVTQSGGVLEHLIRSVEVECLPTDIVEHIDVDVSQLAIAQSLSVGDIKVDAAKYVILTNKTLPLAAVSAPREEEVVATPEAAAGAAEPEVLREKKPEDGEAAEAGKDAKGGAKPAAGKDAKDAAKPAAKDAKPAAKDAKK